MIKGKRFCIFVKNELLPFWYKSRKIADNLNISITDVILNHKYRDDDYVKQELKKAENINNISEIIEKQKNLIRVATLFKETLSRLTILNNCRMPRVGIMLYIKNEIDILNDYDVIPSIKNYYLRFFKKIRIELNKQKTNDDFKRILDKLLVTFEQMVKTISVSDKFINNSDNFKYRDKFPDDNDNFLDYKK